MKNHLARATAIILTFFSISAFAQTLSLNDASVIQSKTKRIGVNIGSINYYDSGQLLKNLVGYLNPTFEPTTSKQIWPLTSAGTTKRFSNGDQYDAVPQDYWAGASFTIVASQSNNGQAGCTGTIASNTGAVSISSIKASGTTVTIVTTSASGYTPGDQIAVQDSSNGTFNGYPAGTIASVTGTTIVVTYTTAPNGTSTGGNANQFLAPVFTTTAPCAGPFSVGDVVILSKTTAPTPESWWEADQGGLWANIGGGGTITSDITDLCSTCGTQAVEFNATPGGSRSGASWYWDSNTSDIFTLMSGTFQLSFWAKIASGSPTLHLSMGRQSTGGFSCSTFTPALSSTWAQYTYNCTASETQGTTSPGEARVQASVTGGAIYFDNLSFQKMGSTQASVFKDEVIARLQTLNPGLLRYWVDQNGESIDNWTAPETSRGPSSAAFMAGPHGYGAYHLSLEDYLVICQILAVEPYLEVPVTFTSADAANLVEFLAAPSSATDSVYGQRRVALGQTTPWASVFPTIHLTYCNECWDGSATGQNLPWRASAPIAAPFNRPSQYYDYGNAAAPVYAAMRADAYYPSNIELVMDIQTGDPGSTDAETATVQQVKPDALEMQGNAMSAVNNSSDAAMWGAAFVEPWARVANPSDPTGTYASVPYLQSLGFCGASGTANCKTNWYESSDSTTAGSIGQTQLDFITAGAGRGVAAALQPLLQMQYFGATNQNYSALAGFGSAGPNGETAKLWGNTVDTGGATNNVRPEFLGAELANDSIIGPMYSCPISSNVTHDFKGSSADGSPTVPAMNGVPYLYAFCFENGTERSLVLINTDLTSSHSLSFAGSNLPVGSVTQRQLAPASLDDMNEASTGAATNLTPASVAIDTATLSSPASIALPPFSVTALDYTAASEATSATPAFAPSAGMSASAQAVSKDPIADAAALSAPAFSLAYGAVSPMQSGSGGTPIINCPSGFAATGSCAMNTTMGAGTAFWLGGSQNGSTPGLVSSSIDLLPTGATHAAMALNFQTQVNVQAFATTFTFVPNGQCIALAVQNSNNNPAFNTRYFSGGAGGECGFYQSFQTPAPNNIFALELDSEYTLASGFDYSSAQIYQPAQAPVTTSGSGFIPWYGTNKQSTFPVPLNSPATSLGTTTGHTYSATVIYTGTDVTLNLYDVTAGGACPGASCFSYSWGGVQIPSIVNGTTAWVGIVGATGVSSTAPLLLNSLVYTVLSAAATPTFSPVAGTYSGTQSVTLSSASSGAVICYNTTGTPATNGTTGCANGTLSTGAISVTSGETIYAVAGGSGYGDSPVSSAAYRIGSTASQPTFLPATGSYVGNQTVFLKSAQGGVICYNTTGGPATNGSTGCGTGTLYTGPITVASNETVYAVSGGTGFTDSAVDSSAYTINQFWGSGTGSTPANSPTYSPIPGTYSGTQAVTLASSTGSSYICYLLASSTPAQPPQPDNQGGCTIGTLYSSPVSVSSSQTLYAMAGTAYKGPPSSLTAGAYVIASGTQAAAPSCSPGSGSSGSPIPVACSNSNSGTTIMCYTENGTTPATNGSGTGCTTGTAISGTSGNITISSTTATLKLVAGTSTLSDSTVSSYGAYTISTVLPTPTFSPAAGTYSSAQSVTISDSTAGTTTYYTTNGTAPTTSSSVYSGAITVSASETLEAMAVETGYTDSAVATAAYTINLPAAAAPTFSPAAGTYTSAQTVTVSTTTPSATIYYTTNGTTPTASSSVYSGAISLSASETIEAMAVEAGYANSAVATAAYTINTALPAPTFTPAAGTYSGTQSVAISDATAGTTIYYTTNGTTPTTSSSVYSGAITVNSSETIEAMAVETGHSNSAAATAAYTIDPSALPTPTFTPAAGTYTSSQSVTISDATSGATIYYTTNGTAPTTSSSVYSGAITVSASETVEAIAVKSGSSNSGIASAVYTINLPQVSAPTFTPAAGTYSSTQSVTISDATAGTTIYYTTNGTTPTTSSSVYSGAITVNFSETLEAIAVETGNTNSGVATATYTINVPQVAAPTFTPTAGTYATAQLVTINEATASATIYYTTNGTVPSNSSSVYGGPITVTASETIEAMAVEGGYTNSTAVASAYTISAEPEAATPTFTPPTGTYSTSQSVTLADATAGATIYYTTDGSTPTTSSSVYTGPINVSSTETLQAIAAAGGYLTSAVGAAAYTLDIPIPSFSVAVTPGALDVTAGQSGAATVLVTPQNSFSSPITFSCAGLPAGASCSFTPATVVPSGAMVTTTMTITTSATTVALHRSSSPLFPSSVFAVALFLFGWRKRRGLPIVMVALVALGLSLCTGCATGVFPNSQTTQKAPLSSTVTIVATSGSLQPTANLTLTVQ